MKRIGLIVFSLFLFCSPAHAADLDFLVLPSLMDKGMDAWHRVPKDSAELSTTDEVMRGQVFNLLLPITGYETDQNGQVDLTYDIETFGPDNKIMKSDSDYNILAFKGNLGNKSAILLPKISTSLLFTEVYPLGTYTIKATIHDHISGQKAEKKKTIQLIDFTHGQKDFSSPDDFGKWLMSYHQSPKPKLLIDAVKTIKTDPAWLKEHFGMFSFLRTSFAENNYLFKLAGNAFQSFSKENQKKLLIVSAISGDAHLITKTEDPELHKLYGRAKEIEVPEVNGDINDASQLDFLWGRFFASGRYEPLLKIVSALKLYKYEGSMEDIKSGKIKNPSDDDLEKARLESIYLSAIWSLTSNATQFPLVYKYCAYMFEHEEFDTKVKARLAYILNAATKERSKKD